MPAGSIDEDFDEEDFGEAAAEPVAAAPTAREELELRLEKARTRRRRPSADFEEPLA